MRPTTPLAAALLLAMMPSVALAAPVELDFSRAVIVTSRNGTPMERLAARMLAEEASERCGVKPAVTTSAPAPGRAAIFVGSETRLPAGCPSGALAALSTRGGPADGEGYVLRVASVVGRPVAVAVGRSESGCMFAVGRLLRSLSPSTKRIVLPVADIATTPVNALRGHQLGWRPTANSYDRWGLKEYEQYLRDLVMWGVNSIELIPFDRSYDRAKNLEFTCRLADLVASYGMKVWLWYGLDDTWPDDMAQAGVTPGAPVCPSRSDGRKVILERRRELFKAMRHLDAVLVPGGDPAGCPCDKCKPWVQTMLPVCAEITSIMRQYHPKAQMWVSNQGFRGPDNEWFYNYLRVAKPKWLAGLVAGPWAEETIPAMRANAPREYPIRLYPDICHTVRCQYPAREWDQAFALTLNREPPMYRPTEHAHIARLYQKVSCGAITYSDGVTDDLNKVIWGAMLWDPKTTTDAVLRDYARSSYRGADPGRVVAGLKGLEAAWRGPLAQNETVEKTLTLWRDLETGGPPALSANWRFQMALTTATYHAYVRRRLIAHRATERRVYAALEGVRSGDQDVTVPAALSEAIAIIDEADREPVEPQMKQDLLDLGGRLFRSIGMQMSVPLWGASGAERGAIMDSLDQVLWDRDWLKAQLLPLQVMSATPRIRNGIERILKWEDPGPGGFYDDLGNPARQPHLVHQKRWEQDPGYVESPRCDFRHLQPGDRLNWAKYAESLYDTPILMRYTGLDPDASYTLRATYSGRYKPTMVLTAGRITIHDAVATPATPAPMEWVVPVLATVTGTLELKWERTAGRGAQVSEVWLIKEPR